MISSHQRIFFATVLLACGAVADEMTVSTESEFQTLRVSVQTPSPCWAIEIEAVYSTDQELLVVSKLAPPSAEESCIQMVGQAEDEISLKAPLSRVKHLILGRTWDTRRDSSGWGPEADYVYPKSNEELSSMLTDARRMPETGEKARDGHAEVAQPTMLSR